MYWQDALIPEVKIDQLMGIPFAAQDPGSYKAILAFDAYETLLEIQGVIRELDGQLEDPNLMRLTRERLKLFKTAKESQLKTLSRLFIPLGYQSISFAELNRHLGQKHSRHLLLSHYENLGRDWGWGQAESAVSSDLAKKVAGDLKLKGVKNMLALGAGACRLPYDLHQWLKPDSTLCVDINPFLLSCAQRIVSGERMELQMFPPVPNDLHSFAVKSELKFPEPVHGSFEFLVHDLEEWALKEETFDLVLTPWFIDVVPIATPRLFSLINRVLKPGGHWLNFGPIGFNRRKFSQFFSREEVTHLVKKSSFKILNEAYAPVPYFQHPAAGNWRTEHMLIFLAQKETDCALIEAVKGPQFPEWIEDTTQPIELTLPVSEMQKSFEFSLDLLKGISSGASVQSLGKKLAESRGLTQEQAEYLISSMLLQWKNQSSSAY